MLNRFDVWLMDCSLSTLVHYVTVSIWESGNITIFRLPNLMSQYLITIPSPLPPPLRWLYAVDGTKYQMILVKLRETNKIALLPCRKNLTHRTRSADSTVRNGSVSARCYWMIYKGLCTIKGQGKRTENRE